MGALCLTVVYAMNASGQSCSAPVTRGSLSGASRLVSACLLLAASAYYFWWGISDERHGPLMGAVLFLIAGCMHLWRWLSYRSGAWQIQWEGFHVRILDHGRIDYEGELAGLESIDQDGRGYFLRIAGGIEFRLRRGDSTAEFEALLDKCQQERRRVGLGHSS